MPVLVRLQRLFEAGALARRLTLPARQQSRLFQHAPYARRTHCHYIVI